jgi:hypothetical protein
MSTQQIRRLSGSLSLAVAALALGLSLEAHAAIVYACLGPSEQPSLVRTWVTAYYAGEFPLDESTCEKIVKKAVAACHKAVSEAEKCQDKLYGALRSIAKPACEGDAGCIDDAKQSIEAGASSLEEDADSAHDDCDGDFAESLFDYCVTGIQ